MVTNKIGNRAGYLKANAFIVILFCVFLYPPHPIAFPKAIQIITLAFSCIYLLFNRVIIRQYIEKSYKTVFISSILILLSLIIPVVYETNDFSYVKITSIFFKSTIIMLCLLTVIIKKHGYKKQLQYFVYYYAIAQLVYVVGTLVLALSPSVQNTWFSFFTKSVNSAERLNYYGYTFRIGWQGFSGFRSTLHCTIALAFALYLRINPKEKYINGFQFLLLFLGSISGNLFYGRSGLSVSVIILIIMLFCLKKERIMTIAKISVLSVLILLCINSLKDLPMFNKWYNWMSTPFVNLIETGDMDNGSVSRLQEMSKTRIEPTTVLVGDGYFMKDGRYYMHTDIGFMRIILFWGLIGAIPTYYLVAKSLYDVKGISKILAVQLLTIFLVFEYKGDVYYEFVPLITVMVFAMNNRGYIK